MLVLRSVSALTIAVFAQMGHHNNSPSKRVPVPPTTKYDDYFRKFSKRYFGPGFSWRIFKAQAMAESGLDSTAKSWVGARGLMQLMPETYNEIRAHWHELKSVEDAQSNIAAGVANDAYLWGFFKKVETNPQHYRFMMAGYNAGAGTIQHAQKVARDKNKNPLDWSDISVIAPQVDRWRYQETLGYVNQIARNYQRLKDMDPIPPVEIDLEKP